MCWKLDRFSKLHNTLRVILNNLLWRLPTFAKYGVGRILRYSRIPYRLVKPGSTIVQIGCAWDLLHAGRSRAIYFSLFVGENGQVIIIEPNVENIRKLRSFISKGKIGNIIVVEKGAWSRKDKLRFLCDPKHPASNLLEEVFNEGRKDRENYDTVEIEVNSVDNILGGLGIERVNMISITTNGAEKEILEGMRESLNRCKYISLVKGKDKQYPILEEYGYLEVGADDRGYTFVKKQHV